MKPGTPDFHSATTVDSYVMDYCERIELIIGSIADQRTIDCLRLVIAALESLAIREVVQP